MARLFTGNAGANSVGTVVGPSMSAYSTASVSMWLNTTFANNTRFALEYGSPNFLSDGWIVFPNQSSNKFRFGFGWSGTGEWSDDFNRPSGGAWHHYLFTYDRINQQNYAWVDGVLQTTATGVHSAGTPTTYFANSNLYLMCRIATGFNQPGTLAHVAVWGNVLFGLAEAQHLSKSVSPLAVRPGALVIYLPLDGPQRETAYGPMGAPLKNLITMGSEATPAAFKFGHDPIPRNPRKKAVLV